MKTTPKVSASILCADFTKLGDEIKKCEDAGIDSLHIDVMDGHFVPNISIGSVIIEAIRPLTKLPIQTHLMIENPTMYIDQFIDAGSDAIMIQVECYGPLRPHCREKGKFPKEVDMVDSALMKRDIEKIRKRGKKAYAVLNPGTPFCIYALLNDLDGVLVMSVNPGFAKQKFMPIALTKIEELKKVFHGEIAVDGGINAETASGIVKAGATNLITASYFFSSQDPAGVVRTLKSLR